MQIRIFPDKRSLGHAAAEQAAATLRATLSHAGSVRLVAATGASQFEFLDALTSMNGIGWSRVELFHLDEYVGLPVTHPASFRKYLFERLINKTGITRHHLLDGEGDPRATIKKAGEKLRATPVHLAFAGIGENGHLAFNDPPADFKSEEPYLLVDLDKACRQQQVNEGWFAGLSDVPTKAISMSIRQILRAREIIAVVPDARKAKAVQVCFEGKISPLAPASILREHPNATIYLDSESASLLSAETIVKYSGSPYR